MPRRPLRRCRGWAATAAVAGLLGVASQAGAVETDAGAAVFSQVCSACHQADGGGTPGLAPPLKGPHWQRLLAERSYLPRVVAFGMTGKIKVGDSTYNSAMLAQAQLDDDSLASVINFVASTLNQSHLPPGWRPYDAAEVAAVRASRHGTLEQRQLRRQLLGE